MGYLKEALGPGKAPRFVGGVALATVLFFGLMAALMVVSTQAPNFGRQYLSAIVALPVIGAGLSWLLQAAQAKPQPAGESNELLADEMLLFRRALEELRKTAQTRVGQGGLILAISLVAVVVLGAGHSGVEWLLLLVPVLLTHDLGPLVAMRVFGCEDPGVLLLVPLARKAATGRKDRAPGWQQAVVLLLGPAPGLLLAFGMTIALRGSQPHPLLEALVPLMLSVNAALLLPVAPFAGARVVSLLLFAEHLRLSVVFAGLGALALVLLGPALDLWALAAVGVVGFLSIRTRYRVARCAARLRARLDVEHASPRAADASDELLQSLVVDWKESSPRGLKQLSPAVLAGFITLIYEQAVVPRVGVRARLLLGAAYLALFIPSAFLLVQSLD